MSACVFRFLLYVFLKQTAFLVPDRKIKVISPIFFLLPPWGTTDRNFPPLAPLSSFFRFPAGEPTKFGFPPQNRHSQINRLRVFVRLWLFKGLGVHWILGRRVIGWGGGIKLKDQDRRQCSCEKALDWWARLCMKDEEEKKKKSEDGYWGFVDCSLSNVKPWPKPTSPHLPFFLKIASDFAGLFPTNPTRSSPPLDLSSRPGGGELVREGSAETIMVRKPNLQTCLNLPMFSSAAAAWGWFHPHGPPALTNLVGRFPSPRAQVLFWEHLLGSLAVARPNLGPAPRAASPPQLKTSIEYKKNSYINIISSDSADSGSDFTSTLLSSSSHKDFLIPQWSQGCLLDLCSIAVDGIDSECFFKN